MADHIFIAVTMGYWGKGSTVDEAKANLRKAGGTLTKHVVYLLPPGVTNGWVDDMGRTCWEWATEEEADFTAQPTIVASRGVKL